jgi:hypothetical protein
MPAMAWIGGASRCVADDTIGEEGDVYKLSAPFSKKKSCRHSIYRGRRLIGGSYKIIPIRVVLI